MSETSVTLVPLSPSSWDRFIRYGVESFRYGSLEEFGVRNTHFEDGGEIISASMIEQVVNAPGAESYCIMQGGEMVGGLILKLDRERHKGELEFLYVSSNVHSKGIGYAAWCEVERMFLDIDIWETVTPHFETRNIHFYVNRCGFRIVEFYNRHHPYPAATEEESREYDNYFRFEKRISHKR